MFEDIVKQRGRLSSEAATVAEDILDSDVYSIPIKYGALQHRPQDDPDAPPLLQLEKDQ